MAHLTRFLIFVFLIVVSTACKQSDDTFAFVDEGSGENNQGPAAITTTSPSVATVIMCVSDNIRCGNLGSLTNGSTQSFTVSVTGTAPITYEWRLDGTVIGGATSSIYNLTASPGGVGAGTYSLLVTASNSEGSDTHTFTVKVNEPPELGVSSPTNAETLGLNYSSLLTLQQLSADANADAISYVWQYEGATSATLTGSAIAGGSQGVYSPVVGHVGNRTIKIIARDAHYNETGAGKYEPEEYSWPVNVNYFSDDCNNLSAGGICTAIGRPGLMTDTDATPDGAYSALTEPVKLKPNYMFNDGSGNLFISDSDNHVIWFHNRSGASVTRLGRIIAAGKIRILIGNGAAGKTTDSNGTYAYEKYKLNGPQMMYYDSVGDYLYIADFYNHRVVRVGSNGQGYRVFGNEAVTPNDATSNGTGVLARTHICPFPVGLVVNAAKTLMWVSCTGNGSNNLSAIKEIDISNPTASLWTASIAVGRVNTVPGGVLQNGNADGVGGYGIATAQTDHPWSLALDLNENLYFTDNNQRGTLRVLKRAANPTTYFEPAVAAGVIGTVYTLAGGNGDNPSSSIDSGTGPFRMRDARGFVIDEPVMGAIRGFYISHGLRFMVTYMTNSTSNVTYGNNTIQGGAAVGAPTGAQATNILTLVGHGLANNDAVYFTALTGGAGLAINTNYYVRGVAGNTFQLETAVTGGTIDFTTDITASTMRRATMAGIIWGVYADPDIPSSTSPATSNRMFNPNGLLLDGPDLLLADTMNFVIRKLDTSIANGAVSTITGGIAYAHRNRSDATAAEPAPSTELYLPDNMLFDESGSNNRILFGDNGALSASWTAHELFPTQSTASFNSNYRIRSLDLNTGLVSTLLGSGFGNADSNTQAPTAAVMRGLRGLTMTTDGSLLFADRYINGGASNNCQIRAFNMTGSLQTYFGTAATNNMITTIAGNFLSGCASSSPSVATSTGMYFPEGMAISGTNLYISEYQRHCILKVDSSGNLTQDIGACGTAADVNGTFGLARFRFPRQLLQDPRFPTNFFVIDQSDQSTSSIKYVNLSGADCGVGNTCGVAGTDTVDQQVSTPLIIGGGYGRALAYYKDATSINNDLICYSSSDSHNNSVLPFVNSAYGAHNVICKNRVSGAQSIRIGSTDGAILSSGKQVDQEDEGDVVAGGVLDVRLSGPSGLAFDSNGNLFISEKDAHIVRKVKKWW